MMKKLLIILLLLPFLFSANQGEIPPTGEEFGESGCLYTTADLLGTWLEDPKEGGITAGTLLAAVLLFTVVIIAMIYMFGMATNNPKLLVFSKDEMFHLGVSIIILVSIGGVLTLSCIVGNAFLGYTFESLGVQGSLCFKPAENLNSHAGCYLSVMESDAKKLVSYSIQKSIKYEMDSTWVYTQNFPLMGIVTTPRDAFKKTFAMQYDSMNNMFATPSLVSISMQKIFITLILKYSVVLIIPIAFLLRVFPPTRQGGNILIAFSAGVLVFLPLLYSISGVMYEVSDTQMDCDEPLPSI